MRQPFARVWMLIGVLATITLGIAMWRLADMDALASDHSVPWWVLIPLFAIAEILVVHIDIQRETQSISLSEVPLVAGLVLAAPLELVIAQTVGAFLALTLHRRQAPIKLAFNVAQLAFIATVAVVVFRAFPLVPGDVGPRLWLAALVATLVADLVSIALIHAVFAIVEGRTSLAGLRSFVGFGMLSAIANCALGLLGVVLVLRDPISGLLMVVPAAVTTAAYRRFWAELRRREHLEFLYGSMRRLGDERDIDSAVAQLLRDACEAFRSTTAVVILTPDEPGRPALRAILGVAESSPEIAEFSIDPAALTGHEAEAVIHTSGAILPRLLAGVVVGEAMTVALAGEQGPIGIMVVADRLSDVGRYTAADRELFRTFATHAGLALQHRHLQRSVGELTRANDELVVKAFHDPLTQLPNRELFMDRVGHALEGDGTHSVAYGVLFIDLDGFKDINDTHGHATGDHVLVAVAERLRACLRPGDTAARLGGDEFAVLCRVSDADEANVVANRLTDALRQPVTSGGSRVQVRASIGISIGASGRGVDAADLVAAADHEMYGVKFARKAGRRDREGSPGAAPR